MVVQPALPSHGAWLCRQGATGKKRFGHPSLSMKCALTSAHVFMRFAPLKLVSSVRRLVRA
jgi:hypothetical protein